MRCWLRSRLRLFYERRRSRAPGPDSRLTGPDLIRFLAASAILAGYAALTRMRLPERRDLPAVFLAGLLAFTLYHVARNYGEAPVSAGAASILINTAPIFTALLAVAVLGNGSGRSGGSGRG